MSATFAVQITKENLKFSAAHFIAYPGFREPLHGHNYQVGVRIEGSLGPMGYVLDFGLIKKQLKEIVDRLDERTIIPARSECLKIDQIGNQVHVYYEQDEFVFPAADLALLEIAHSSAEELARFIWNELYNSLNNQKILKDVKSIEISVAEGPGQAAHYRQNIGA
jgi:6-pyruvoyltetrahydropterin/6-carboxytetrahydropterin synthase